MLAAAAKWKNRRTDMKDMLTALRVKSEAEIKKVDAADETKAADNARNRILGKEERLRIAADIGDTETAQELIADGVPVDATHRSSGNTALIYAAIKGHVAIATLLIEAECNVNKKDHKGEAAMIHAFKADKKKLVSLLLQHRADPGAELLLAACCFLPFDVCCFLSHSLCLARTDCTDWVSHCGCLIVGTSLWVPHCACLIVRVSLWVHMCHR